MTYRDILPWSKMPPRREPVRTLSVSRFASRIHIVICGHELCAIGLLTAQEGKPSTYAPRSLGYEVELSSRAVDDVVAEGVDESKVVPLQSWTTLAMAKMNGETRGFIPAVRARRRRYQKQICRAVRVVPVGEFSVLLSLNRPDMPTTSCCSHAANIRPDSFPTLTGPWDVSHNKGDSAEARGYAIVVSTRLVPVGKGSCPLHGRAKGPRGGIRSRRMDKPAARGSTPANCPKTNLATLESAMSTIHPTTNLTHPPHYMDKAVMWGLAEARESRARASVAVLLKY